MIRHPHVYASFFMSITQDGNNDQNMGNAIDSKVSQGQARAQLDSMENLGSLKLFSISA